MIYDDIRSKIVRQELDIIEAGQHFKSYSAKVKYLPENIEKPDFFSLCYNMLKKCDTVIVYTQKQDEFEMLYKFLVTYVDIENKEVKVKLIRKVDLMNLDKEEELEAVPADGMTNAAVINIVGEQLDKALTPILEKLKAIEETVTAYTKDTDDQLEEIENNIAALQSKSEKSTKPKN